MKNFLSALPQLNLSFVVSASRSLFLLTVCGGCLVHFSANSISAALPPNSGAINVKELGAKGDGVSDDTQVIQQALATKDRLIYLPNGTYLVCDTIQWGDPQKRRILQGESREGTIIKLKDDCPGFMDANNPKPVITTFEGKSTGQAFRNSIYDLTVDVGSGNPGAIGIRFTNNNQGGIRNVVIKSSDPNKQGHTGLALTQAWPGPGMFKDIVIDGFNYGIQVRHPEYSNVFENLTLKNQKIAGIENKANILSIRGLISENSVPVIQNVEDGRGLIVVIDGDFQGGSPSHSAIQNQKGNLYARNIKTSGYQSAIENYENIIPGNSVTEYVSEEISSLFPTPSHSLNLPIQDFPSIHDEDFVNWVSITEFGANGSDDLDDTEAIQKAIDSGKSTIYFPTGYYLISNTINIRGNVARIIGLESTIRVADELREREAPVFRFENGSQDVTVLERFWGDYGGGNFHWVEHASEKTLVLRNISTGSGKAYRNTGSGRLFIEDVTAADWVFNNQDVWARQINPENNGTKIVNNGGNLWILGLKTERAGTVVETTGGGKTEVLGGLIYPASAEVPADQPAFINDNSSLSVVMGESHHGGGRYETIVRETRNGVTKTLTRNTLPRRGSGSMIPLYVGYEASDQDDQAMTQPKEVPEPTTLGAIALVGSGILCARRRKARGKA